MRQVSQNRAGFEFSDEAMAMAISNEASDVKVNPASINKSYRALIRPVVFKWCFCS